MTREYIVQVSDAINTDAFERFEKEWSPDELVRCKDCCNGQCAIQFKFAYPDKPEEWFCAYCKRNEEG